MDQSAKGKVLSGIIWGSFIFILLVIGAIVLDINRCNSAKQCNSEFLSTLVTDIYIWLPVCLVAGIVLVFLNAALNFFNNERDD